MENYDRAMAVLAKARPDIDYSERERYAVQIAQVRALLAIADELRAHRELMTEYLNRGEEDEEI